MNIDRILRALSTGGLSLITKDHEERGGNAVCMNDTLDSSSSGCCTGGHMWVWSGDCPGWPYDGMLCSCGQIRYDKREALREQIKSLESELAELGDGEEVQSAAFVIVS